MRVTEIVYLPGDEVGEAVTPIRIGEGGAHRDLADHRGHACLVERHLRVAIGYSPGDTRGLRGRDDGGRGE